MFELMQFFALISNMLFFLLLSLLILTKSATKNYKCEKNMKISMKTMQSQPLLQKIESGSHRFS
jgi:hypothetical protein